MVTGRPEGPADRERLLGIYLNDHVAGATSGLELARRLARNHRGTRFGHDLARIADEVAEDRAGLLALIEALGLPVRRHKAVAGWLAERAGRLKPSGRMVRRSPLSSLLELEAMRVGVEGKAAGWRVLRLIAERDPRLDSARLDALIARAVEQRRLLEGMRLEAAGALFRR